MLRKISILAATTAIGFVSAGSAQAADNIIPAAAINGNGASSIANILVQELNCFGGPNNPLGKSNGTSTAVPDHNYVPTSPTAANPAYNCATPSVQDLVDGHYVSTGSGGGKTSWSNFNSTGIATNPFGSWGHIQFAFSDSPIASGDITTYNSNAAGTAGAAIQIPMYVLPVAVAYKPLYGKVLTGAGVKELTFKLKYPRKDGTGGLRLKRATYCKIFNGEITNWNNALIKADNGNQSLMDDDDTLARWSTAGVPIRLVGRQEKSGTTNIFSRHLGTICGGLVATNKYGAGNDLLPAAAQGTAVYNKTTGVLQSGTETDGVFGVADGSDGVAKAVDLAVADPTTLGQVNLNGRLGYLGADWVLPATLSASQLASADLQSGTTASFKAPTAANATAAFKGILPPQSATTGKYSPSAVATGSMAGLRSDPLSWVFPASTTYVDKNGVNGVNPIAAPVAGYPIVGTTNALLYTCYTPANRKAMQTFLEFHFGKVTVADDLTKVPAKLTNSTAKGVDTLMLGIMPRNGVAALPAPFVTAIVETFLTKTVSGNNPGALNLWIQDKLQTKSTVVTAANPNCASLTGA